MSKPGQHEALAPIPFEFIPKGRTARDAAYYRAMRRIGRLNRQVIWEKTQKAWSDTIFYGTGYMQFDHSERGGSGR